MIYDVIKKIRNIQTGAIRRQLNSFGTAFGDTLLPKNDDGSFGPVKLGVNILFFGNIYSNLFVTQK